MPAISVIVPVYRAEKFLGACVESVLSQTFMDWELLLIEDGSPDGSGALCDEYAARDPRVCAFHQENGGVSSARNLGLAHAEGQCIAFLDSDDGFEPETLATLWRLRQESGTDTAGCAHWNVSPSGEQTPEKLLPAGIYRGDELREKVLYPLLGDRLCPPIFNGFIWRYLFDAAILRQHGIRFEGAYLEDEVFLLEYFAHAESLAVTETPLYRYLMNPDSATRKYMKDYMAVFSRFLERKTAFAERYGLAAARPRWRENTLWAGLLIAIGNEYARGNPKSPREKQRTVEAICRRPEMAEAIRTFRPERLGRNKQMVADLVRGGHFGLLTALYRFKNQM